MEKTIKLIGSICIVLLMFVFASAMCFMTYAMFKELFLRYLLLNVATFFAGYAAIEIFYNKNTSDNILYLINNKKINEQYLVWGVAALIWGYLFFKSYDFSVYLFFFCLQALGLFGTSLLGLEIIKIKKRFFTKKKSRFKFILPDNEEFDEEVKKILEENQNKKKKSN